MKWAESNVNCEDDSSCGCSQSERFKFVSTWFILNLFTCLYKYLLLGWLVVLSHTLSLLSKSVHQLQRIEWSSTLRLHYPYFFVLQVIDTKEFVEKIIGLETWADGFYLSMKLCWMTTFNWHQYCSDQCAYYQHRTQHWSEHFLNL